jgi:hypothetical protein
MPSTAWDRLAVADDLFELRELVHLAAQQEFSDFFKLQPGTISDDGSAVVGRAGFLFVNDGSNQWKDQISGELTIAPDVLDATLAKLESYSSRLSSLGVTFRFVIIPEKDIIYPDLSPNVVSSLGTKRAAQQISARYSSHTLYVKDQLAAASVAATTYHARNSHFNFFGGLVVAEQIYESLGIEFPAESNIPSTLVFWPDDLSLKWHKNLTTRRRILRRFYAEDEIVKVESHVGRYLIIRNENAPNKRPIVIFGDSYAWNPDAGVARCLALGFSEVHFLWKKQIDWELIEKVRPATVLLQSAERFLIKGLP